MKILEQALNKINPIHKDQKDFLLIIIPALIASAGKKPCETSLVMQES